MIKTQLCTYKFRNTTVFYRLELILVLRIEVGSRKLYYRLKRKDLKLFLETTYTTSFKLILGGTICIAISTLQRLWHTTQIWKVSTNAGVMYAAIDYTAYFSKEICDATKQRLTTINQLKTNQVKLYKPFCFHLQVCLASSQILSDGFQRGSDDQ